MPQSSEDLAKVVAYMKAHWPSQVPEKWQVKLTEYPEIVQKVVADFSAEASRRRRFVRLAGLSGSGKTTQLLPAAEAYFEKMNVQPLVVAARKFVPYHPYYAEILEHYGAENLRKMTDEFATIMMFLTLYEFFKMGVDMILDVTFLDPIAEGMLVKMLRENNYEMLTLMIAVAPEVTERFLGQRNWRHTKETEAEFVRATEKALEFYGEVCGEERIIMWNVYEEGPVYDGGMKGAKGIYLQYMEDKMSEHDKDELARAKVEYMKKENL